jgi:Domain of unknown function (DUF4411)
LDANVFIQAKNGPYGFDIAPGFWELIEDFAKQGILRSPIRVRKELTDLKKDELSKWAVRDSVRDSGLFGASSDRAVQKIYGEIAQFVQDKYGTVKSKSFLDHGDPWVIAHACASRGLVVTGKT